MFGQRPKATLFGGVVLAGLALPVQADTHRKPADIVSQGPPIAVTVINNNWLDVRIYAVGGSGQYWRLGTVTGNTSGRFRLPERLTTTTGEVHFVADPIGSTVSDVSFSVLVSPGDVIEYWVQPDITASYVRVL